MLNHGTEGTSEPFINILRMEVIVLLKKLMIKYFSANSSTTNYETKTHEFNTSPLLLVVHSLISNDVHQKTSLL